MSNPSKLLSLQTYFPLYRITLHSAACIKPFAGKLTFASHVHVLHWRVTITEVRGHFCPPNWTIPSFKEH